ncbi:A/G-specific adenine glycosylase [Geminicoccaceae bacterium 1502E]|nr:A/G-specific adenine glycosylase [Geminicoccaceae bacterium 1502E]
MERPAPPSEPVAPERHTPLRQTLLAWYDASRRRLPWRALPGETADPYAVLVSEIMLQQTTVATVTGRYAAFLERFPDLATLAAAPLDDVLHAWQGLGYYRRARALHACAVAVAAQHDGRLPGSVAGLRALPGIGAYTAAAVAAIAFGEAAVPVDANVERVLARLIGLQEPLPRGRRQIDRAAASLAREERSADFAQAVMELGALVCTPRAPRCMLCPWQGDCVAAASGLQEELPRRKAKAARPTREAVAYLLRREDGAVLFRRRPEEGLLGGMIELPSSAWGERPADLHAEAPAAAAWRLLPGEVRHVFTHFALVLRLAEAHVATPPPGLWAQPAEFSSLALPTLTKKLLRHAGLGCRGDAR